MGIVGGQPRQPESIVVEDRDEAADVTAGRDEPGDARSNRGVDCERARQQRSPRKVDGQLVGDTGELRGWPLGSGDNEQGVGQAAACRSASGAARPLGHRVRAGVDADDERVGLTSSPIDDRLTVPGAEVDDDASGAAAKFVELADVGLAGEPAGHGAHGRNLHFQRE
jgi:hypothetical protein